MLNLFEKLPYKDFFKINSIFMINPTILTALLIPPTFHLEKPLKTQLCLQIKVKSFSFLPLSKNFTSSQQIGTRSSTNLYKQLLERLRRWSRSGLVKQQSSVCIQLKEQNLSDPILPFGDLEKDMINDLGTSVMWFILDIKTLCSLKTVSQLKMRTSLFSSMSQQEERVRFLSLGILRRIEKKLISSHDQMMCL